MVLYILNDEIYVHCVYINIFLCYNYISFYNNYLHLLIFNQLQPILHNLSKLLFLLIPINSIISD